MLTALVLLAGCGTVRAASLLQDALEPPQTFATEVAESEEIVPTREGGVRLRIVRPARTAEPLPAFLLCHGAHEDGAEQPQLVALARALAVHGAMAAVVDLPPLRQFRMDTEDPRRIAGVARWLAARTDLVRDGRVALLGISVGGAYALIAAGDPDLAGRVSCVVAFGAYPDIGELLH